MSTANGYVECNTDGNSERLYENAPRDQPKELEEDDIYEEI